MESQVIHPLRLSACLLLPLATAAVASATPMPLRIYYVSTHGNDHAVGSRQHPWRTLQHAAYVASGGSTVIVRAGTYAALSSARALTWKAQGKVVVDVGSRPQLWNVPTGNLQIEGFRFWVASGYSYPLIEVRGNASVVFAGDSVSGQPVDPIVDPSAGTGSITVTGGSFSYPSATKNSPILIAAGTWHVKVADSHFYVSSASQAQPVITIENQRAPVVSGNSIRTTTTGVLSAVSIESTGAVAFGAKITDNTIRSHSLQGYVIHVGLDWSTSADGKMNGAVIEGNKIFGPYHFHPNLKTTVGTHAIFDGYSLNATVKGNVVNGDGYGVVIKGKGQEYTKGGIFDNTFVNSDGVQTILVKGVRGVNVEGNSIKESGKRSTLAISAVINPESGNAAATRMSVRNNRILVGGTGPVLYVDPAAVSGFNSNDNTICETQLGSVARIGPSFYTASQWQMMGYDRNSTFSSSCSSTGD